MASPKPVYLSVITTSFTVFQIIVVPIPRDLYTVDSLLNSDASEAEQSTDELSKTQK